MKFRIQLLAFALLFSCFSYTAQAKTSNNIELNSARAVEIQQRVQDIKAMNFSHLTMVERKDLKQELKGMNKELREMGPSYIYISVGTLLVIILLLIILL